MNLQDKIESMLNSKTNKDDKLYLFLSENNETFLCDKLAGLIYGCAIGDCLGLQCEGKSLEDIKKIFKEGVHDMTKQDIRGILAGDWSDDTDHLILNMEVLEETKFIFDMKLLAEKLYNWKKIGFYELGDQAGMGIGQTLSYILSKPGYLNDPVEKSREAYVNLGGTNASNGAIMRCGILSFMKNWQHLAISQTIITHVDLRCIYSVWLMLYMCRLLLTGKYKNVDIDDLFVEADSFIIRKDHINEFYRYKKIYIGNLDNLLDNLELTESNAYSYTLKTLGCAIYSFRRIKEGNVNSANDYQKIQLDIVNRGGDADTNAAVSGQILGVHLGYDKLPKTWMYELKHKSWLDKKIISFLKKLNCFIKN